MTANPDTIQSDAIKRLEEYKVTDADIEVIKKCEKLQELCQAIYPIHVPICGSISISSNRTRAIYAPTFEQMIAIIGDQFQWLKSNSETEHIVSIRNTIDSKSKTLNDTFKAPTARQALSMACEFVLGGKDLRGGK